MQSRRHSHGHSRNRQPELNDVTCFVIFGICNIAVPDGVYETPPMVRTIVAIMKIMKAHMLLIQGDGPLGTEGLDLIKNIRTIKKLTPRIRRRFITMWAIILY